MPLLPSVPRGRSLLVALAAVLVPLAPVPSASAPPAPLPPARAQPDVLVIKTDDQVMDRLDRMSAYLPQTAAWFAANGREFVNSYASSPSCCQSRASTFVGRYPHNEGVWSQGKGATLDTRGGMAPYLQRAGYRTAIVGKYLNLVYRDLPGYDWWSTVRGACEGPQTEDCSGTSPTAWYYDFRVSSNDPADPAPTFVVPGDPGTGDGYNTTWSGQRLRAYLRAAIAGRESSGRPWYVEWDPTAPHTHDAIATMPEPRYRDLPVPGCDVPVEADRSDKPPYVRAFSTAQSVQAEKVICPAAQRTLRSVDDQFGKVLQELRQAGRLDDTVIVFTSDNGLMNGEHLMSRKFVPYQPSVRVPLLVSWPGHVDVGTDDRLVSGVDLLPTVLEAAGVRPDPALPPVDGRSLLSGEGHRLLLTEYRRDDGWTTKVPAPIPTWAAMTDARHVYVETCTTVVGEPSSVGFREYYDLVEDPGELTNLLADGTTVDDPDVAALHARLSELRTCRGTTSGNACP